MKVLPFGITLFKSPLIKRPLFIHKDDSPEQNEQADVSPPDVVEEAVAKVDKKDSITNSVSPLQKELKHMMDIEMQHMMDIADLIGVRYFPYLRFKLEFAL